MSVNCVKRMRQTTQRKQLQKQQQEQFRQTLLQVRPFGRCCCPHAMVPGGS